MLMLDKYQSFVYLRRIAWNLLHSVVKGFPCNSILPDTTNCLYFQDLQKHFPSRSFNPIVYNPSQSEHVATEAGSTPLAPVLTSKYTTSIDSNTVPTSDASSNGTPLAPILTNTYRSTSENKSPVKEVKSSGNNHHFEEDDIPSPPELTYNYERLKKNVKTEGELPCRI